MGLTGIVNIRRGACLHYAAKAYGEVQGLFLTEVIALSGDRQWL
jgi:hypothetical protein